MPLPQANRFCLGTVEGFFGRQWSWQARRDHASFLTAHGFTTYLYAPKNDDFLRKRWFEAYPDTLFSELTALASHCHSLGLEFGVGLSPFELYRDFSAAKKQQLLRKLDQLNQLQAPLLAVLFDDMLGELPGLAETQLQIFECIRSHSKAEHFALCPTYYSDDPLLVKHFGAQPEQYLETLGAALQLDVDIFWTGPKVISHSYPRDHLQAVSTKLKRKPLLWDNYPVNDAKRLTPFLHLLPFEQRPHSTAVQPATHQGFDLKVINDCCRGLLANPMNQAYLSQFPLQSLASLWHQLQGTRITEAPQLQIVKMLKEDSYLFQLQGLEHLTDETKMALLSRYRAALPDPMAVEVCEWLQGGYAFDPACLT